MAEIRDYLNRKVEVGDFIVSRYRKMFQMSIVTGFTPDNNLRVTTPFAPTIVKTADFIIVPKDEYSLARFKPYFSSQLSASKETLDRWGITDKQQKFLINLFK